MLRHDRARHGMPNSRMPHPIGQALRAISRWAVAASLGAASACTADHAESEVGQPVPRRPPRSATAVQGEAGSMQVPSDAAIAADDATVPIAGTGAAATSGARADASQMRDDDAGVDPEPWRSVWCPAHRPKILLKSQRLTRPIDFIGLYRMRPRRYEGPVYEDADVFLQESRGTACKTSTNVADCVARLNALLVPSAACKTPQGPCTSFAATTLGDEVRVIDVREDLMRLLGSIDGPEKAVIAAFWEGLRVECWDEQSLTGTRTAYREGWYVQTETSCPPYRRTLQIAEDGRVVADVGEETSKPMCATGRRPAGLGAIEPSSADAPLGRYFAEVAQLEAASVLAFERIAQELRAFGARSQLVDAASEAALDEVRHARHMGELARYFGAEPAVPCIEQQPLRARFPFALDNAVEGCVRETFGALLAHHQAALARDPSVALAMARIAEDETRHAELSWEIAAWIEPQLSEAERGELHEARAAAVVQLALELSAPQLGEADRRASGLPGPQVAGAMLDRMRLALASGRVVEDHA